MITNLMDKNIAKILAFFSISPGSRFSRKEIKERAKMNNVPLDNSLIKLIKLKILKKEKNMYSLDLTSKNISIFREIEKLHKELNSLPLEIFYVLIELSSRLASLKSIKNILLFGSYAKLIYSEKSDIDIAIILYDWIDKSIEEKKINDLINRINESNGKKMEVHFFSESDLKHKEDPLIAEILKNSRQVI